MLNRVRRLLKIAGISIVLFAALGFISVFLRGWDWHFSLHDTYFVEVHVSPVFLAALLFVGIALYLYGSWSTA